MELEGAPWITPKFSKFKEFEWLTVALKMAGSSEALRRVFSTVLKLNEETVAYRALYQFGIDEIDDFLALDDADIKEMTAEQEGTWFSFSLM